MTKHKFTFSPDINLGHIISIITALFVGCGLLWQLASFKSEIVFTQKEQAKQITTNTDILKTHSHIIENMTINLTKIISIQDYIEKHPVTPNIINNNSK